MAKKPVNTGNWMKDIFLIKMRKEKIKQVDVARGITTKDRPVSDEYMRKWFNQPGGCVEIGSKVATFLNLSLVEVFQIRVEQKKEEIKNKQSEGMGNIEIKTDGTVRINNEKITDVQQLIDVLDCIGEYETESTGVIALFPFEGGYIEYLMDSCFTSGESANYTELKYEEIMEYYNIK